MKFANRAGFGGGLVVDYPNSKKAKKYYLVLQAGQADQKAKLPRALGVDTEQGPEDTIAYERKRERERMKRSKAKANRVNVKGTREYILHKKELNKAQGKEHIPRDSK